MRAANSAWRTAGSRARVVAPQAGTPVVASPHAPVLPGVAATDDVAQGMPWQNVGWTLSLVGLLVYIWTTTTYTVPLGQISMAAALVGLLLQGQSLRLPPFLVIFGAFVAWCAVGYLGTDYPGVVSRQLEPLWKIWLIAFVVVNSTRTRQQQRVFLFVTLAAFAMYPTRGAIFNYLGGYTLFGRALWNNAYSNPNDLAAFTLLQIGFALALFIREPKGWPKIAALAGMVLLPIVVLLTQSRGAFLALALAGALLVMQQQRRARMRALLGVLAVGIVAAIAAPDSAWERFGGMLKLTSSETIAEADPEGSAEQRFAILQVAADVYRNDPVDGVGWGAYAQAHARQAVASGLHTVAGGEKDAHNTYMRLLAETGTVGGLLYLALLIAVFVPAERLRRRARGVLPRSAQQLGFLQAGLIMFFIAGVFGSFAHLATTYLVIALLWSVCESVTEELRALAPGGTWAAV